METGGISSPIIAADKKVAFETDDGMLYIVKAESKKICESLDFGDEVTGHVNALNQYPISTPRL